MVIFRIYLINTPPSVPKCPSLTLVHTHTHILFLEPKWTCNFNPPSLPLFNSSKSPFLNQAHISYFSTSLLIIVQVCCAHCVLVCTHARCGAAKRPPLLHIEFTHHLNLISWMVPVRLAQHRKSFLKCCTYFRKRYFAQRLRQCSIHT